MGSQHVPKSNVMRLKNPIIEMDCCQSEERMFRIYTMEEAQGYVVLHFVVST